MTVSTASPSINSSASTTPVESPPVESLATENTNVREALPLPTPNQIKGEYPLTISARETVIESRRAIEGILSGSAAKRLVVIVGPCSVHDPEAAIEYAHRLRPLADQVSDVMHVVMRTYFEKPRTTVGWKGLLNDPELKLNGSFDLARGLRTARSLLCEINELGLSTATEALDPVAPQYIGDLIAWSAIGARTTESQTHREMASGLSSPVGLKNGSDGNIQIAIDALQSMRSPHAFLGIDGEGRTCQILTRGNKFGHIILRGGKEPNYDSEYIASCKKLLAAAGWRQNVMVDCSHGNSRKVASNQPAVFSHCIDQVARGEDGIMGLMLESNLVAGAQKIGPRETLVRGKSVTDECIDIETTAQVLMEGARQLRGAGWGCSH